MKGYGLKQKIWLTIVIVALITIVTGAGLTYYLYETFYVDKQKSLLTMQGKELKKFYQTDKGKQEFLERVEWTDQTSDAEVIFTDDPMLLSAGIPYEEFTNNLITFEERQRLLQGKEVIFVRKHPRFNQDILAVTIPLIEGNQLEGAIFLYMPMANVYEPFQSIRIILIGALVLFLIIVVLVGLKMTNQIIRPLKEMESVAQKMSQGDFSKRISVNKKDEIGNLATSFNILASSLEEVDKKRREFLQNVSHELRTPLSYMQGYTEVILEEENLDKVQTDKYVSIIHNEAGRMNRLVNDLLDLAQLEDDSYPMKCDPLPFAQLIMDVAERFELAASQKKMAISVDLDHDIIVNGDADRLEQVVSNLLDNAIRYTPEGKTVKIHLSAEEENAKLLIQDSGRGIPGEDLPRVMERFYRVNKARTRKEGGTGLGLSIVYHIVKKHDGEVVIESEFGRGTSIIIKLPLLSEFE
jgi:signal transduction histidine kinase/flagellar basal body-associated protein FliL